MTQLVLLHVRAGCTSFFLYKKSIDICYASLVTGYILVVFLVIHTVFAYDEFSICVNKADADSVLASFALCRLKSEVGRCCN